MQALSIRPFSSHPFLPPTSINSREETWYNCQNMCILFTGPYICSNPSETYIPYSDNLAISLYSYNFQTPRKAPRKNLVERLSYKIFEDLSFYL